MCSSPCVVVLCSLAAVAVAGDRARPEDCFKVRSMVKADRTADAVDGDEGRYQVVATNACGFTLDAIYVLVRFTDRRERVLSGGLWILYAMPPGQTWVKKFSVPLQAAGFERVVLRKITTNAEEALHTRE